MFAQKKGIKYYIHVCLYFTIIILLSVSLTDYWIESNFDSNYNKSNIKFSLFNFESNNDINISEIFDRYFTLTAKKDNISQNITSKDILPNINLIIKEELRKLDIKNIRNNLLEITDIYSENSTKYNDYTFLFKYNNSEKEIENTELNDILKLKIYENINDIFNKARPNDNLFFSDSTLKTRKEISNYVKSGELKKSIEDVQNIIRKYFIIIQSVVITSIILLFMHLLLILFRGRNKGLLRISGIITVFIPLIVILVFALIYIYLVYIKSNVMTNYFLVYAVGSMLLLLAWILGLFKII